MKNCCICQRQTDYTTKGTNIALCPFCALYEGVEVCDAYARYLAKDPYKPQTFKVFHKEWLKKHPEHRVNLT